MNTGNAPEEGNMNTGNAPKEGNLITTDLKKETNSHPEEGWQTKSDGVVSYRKIAYNDNLSK